MRERHREKERDRPNTLVIFSVTFSRDKQINTAMIFIFYFFTCVILIRLFIWKGLCDVWLLTTPSRLSKSVLADTIPSVAVLSSRKTKHPASATASKVSSSRAAVSNI